MVMRVKVVRNSFFLGRMRRAGEVIEIEDGAPLRRWMSRVPDTTPVRQITASDVLNADLIERFGAVPTARAEVYDDAHAETEYDPLTERRNR
jgi:hypothetical protein